MAENGGPHSGRPVPTSATDASEPVCGRGHHPFDDVSTSTGGCSRNGAPEYSRIERTEAANGTTVREPPKKRSAEVVRYRGHPAGPDPTCVLASWRFPRPRPCPPPLDDASRDWVERRLLKEGWVGCSSDGWGGGRQVTGKITPSGQTQPSTQRESPATVGGRGHRLPTTPGTTSSCGSPIRRARRRYPGPPSRLRAATPDEGRRGRWRPSWDRHRPRRWRIRPTRSLPARG